MSQRLLLRVSPESLQQPLADRPCPYTRCILRVVSEQTPKDTTGAAAAANREVRRSKSPDSPQYSPTTSASSGHESEGEGEELTSKDADEERPAKKPRALGLFANLPAKPRSPIVSGARAGR